MIKTETRGSVVVAACDCCGRFCSAEGGMIVHASHCDGGKRSERYYPVSVETTATVAEIGHRDGAPLNAIGNGEAEDKFHAVHSVNPRDWSRAMNRDD